MRQKKTLRVGQKSYDLEDLPLFFSRRRRLLQQQSLDESIVSGTTFQRLVSLMQMPNPQTIRDMEIGEVYDLMRAVDYFLLYEDEESRWLLNALYRRHRQHVRQASQPLRIEDVYADISPLFQQKMERLQQQERRPYRSTMLKKTQNAIVLSMLRYDGSRLDAQEKGRRRAFISGVLRKRLLEDARSHTNNTTRALANRNHPALRPMLAEADTTAVHTEPLGPRFMAFYIGILRPGDPPSYRIIGHLYRSVDDQEANLERFFRERMRLIEVADVTDQV
ncbi:hypothetical protein EBZ80_02060 [bacterium]|nr:hypothetical protein [bacterium]